MTIYCGIDPGFSGAIALYDPVKNWLEISDCPVVKVNGKSEMLMAGVVDILKSAHINAVFIEKSQSMPKQGVSSTFSYGMGYGSYIGIIATLELPFTKVPPAVWKKALGVPSDKDAARARASELLPAHAHNWLKKGQHGRAEAALIAYYGAGHG